VQGVLLALLAVRLVQVETPPLICLILTAAAHLDIQDWVLLVIQTVALAAQVQVVAHKAVRA
jgi:hypothetical protein